jgi:U3 small nucleolar RNA-associated protein 23
MKVKRTKRAKRIMNFFHFNYQYNEPHNILVDGTFCQAALQSKINLREQLPKYLDTGVEIFTTKCVLEELSRFSLTYKC